MKVRCYCGKEIRIGVQLSRHRIYCKEFKNRGPLPPVIKVKKVKKKMKKPSRVHRNQTLPTELLIQHSLDHRGSVRLRVAISMLDTTPSTPRYVHIVDSMVYMEVNNPGLVWRVVGTVAQALKRLEVEMEREDNDKPDWFKFTGSGVGRRKGQKTADIRGSEADNAGEDLAAADTGTPIGPV